MTEIKNINYVGYAIESDVELELKEDDSYHPSYINLLYLDTKNNGKHVVQISLLLLMP